MGDTYDPVEYELKHELKKGRPAMITIAVASVLVAVALIAFWATYLYYATHPTTPTNKISITTTAARTLFNPVVRETDALGGCSPCDTLGAVQVLTGNLTLSSDLSILVGTTNGQCITTSVDVDGNYTQYCAQSYNFNGAGGIPAGSITGAGDYFVPVDALSYTLTRWGVAGGTLAYKTVLGELTFTTAASESFYDVTMMLQILS